MTFYYPKSYYNHSKRWHIFPLLKALQKEDNYVFGNLALTEDVDTSDVIILPMSWNYYYDTKQVDNVLEFYKQMSCSNKPVISFMFGDFGVKVPESFHGLVYRTSGRKSKLKDIHKGLPVFIEDPIANYYKGQDILFRTYSKLPVVGFCGQANGFGIQTLKELSKTFIKNLLATINLSDKDPDQLISTTFLRWKLLDKLKRSSKLQCNFIIRDKYRAGVKTAKESHPSTLQFYDNIKDSEYVVCMRGAGNFSQRFYETLAMGRIPVFVDTDCVLPLEEMIDWKQRVVWVEYHERHKIADKIVEFHKQHDETSLNSLFIKNRKLWEDHLQLYSFFNRFLFKN